MLEYTKVEYLELYNKVLEYQKDKSKSEPIVEAFKGFMWKFVDLICNTNFNIHDDHLRAFVVLFVDNPYVKKYANNYRHKPEVKRIIISTVDFITKLFSQFSEDDIKDELTCTLLHMARLYKDKEKPSFHNYVDKCFHFHAYKSLNRMIKDCISRGLYEEYLEDIAVDTSSIIDYEEAVNKADYKLRIDNATIPVIRVNIEDCRLDSTLNINWINGATCDDTFKVLSPLERKIIKYYYIDEIGDEEIGDMLGMCRVSICKKRNEAKQKLLKSSRGERNGF